MRKALAALILLVASVSAALAQRVQNPNNAAVVCAYNAVPPTLTSGWFGYVQCDNTGKLSVNASVSASITGFPTIQSTGIPIAVTTGGVTGTLPTGTVVVASNVGATIGAYCKLGASATTSDQLIPPNSWFAFTVGANTQLTCITASSTTTVNMVGGSGIPTGSGGGGGGSGGGGTSSAFDAAFPASGTAIGLSDGTNMKSWLTALIQTKTGVNGNNMGSVAPWLWNGTSFDAWTGTAALGANVQVKSGGVASGALAAGALATGAGVDGWDLTQGAIADAAVTAGATGSVSAKLRSISRDIGTIATLAATPLPAQTTNTVNIGAVMSAGSGYETVAASQTAQVLGPTGATGDYLSHCVIYPASTSPGVVTVFDNANAAATNVIAFPGGATSTSNLVPIAIPVGAVSTAGAWKVTTGANVSITCYGKFT